MASEVVWDEVILVVAVVVGVLRLQASKVPSMTASNRLFTSLVETSHAAVKLNAPMTSQDTPTDSSSDTWYALIAVVKPTCTAVQLEVSWRTDRPSLCSAQVMFIVEVTPQSSKS